MRRIAYRILMGLTACGAWLGAEEARAQVGQGGAGTTPPAAGLVNPYMSPYMNPYLNPSQTTNATSRSDAMIYLWMAQQQQGGLLGPRPTAASRASSTGSRVAEMPRSAMQPGAGASRYFSRGPASVGRGNEGLGKRYQRLNRYYGNNGR